MPYPKDKLNANETVALDMHPHWWYFAEPVASVLGAIVFAVIAYSKGGDGTVGKSLKWIALILLVATTAWLVVRYLKWATTHFVITSQRLIFRHGVIAKSGIEIPLDRVMNVNFGQSIFERIVNAGNLLIESGGEDGQQRFTDIRNADDVANLIHRVVEESQNRRVGAAAPMPATGVDLADQLERLEGMRDRGTLTADEFEAQKRRLLES